MNDFGVGFHPTTVMPGSRQGDLALNLRLLKIAFHIVSLRDTDHRFWLKRTKARFASGDFDSVLLGLVCRP